jgi:hypothetical protein
MLSDAAQPKNNGVNKRGALKNNETLKQGKPKNNDVSKRGRLTNRDANKQNGMKRRVVAAPIRAAAIHEVLTLSLIHTQSSVSDAEQQRRRFEQPTGMRCPFIILIRSRIWELNCKLLRKRRPRN